MVIVHANDIVKLAANRLIGDAALDTMIHMAIVVLQIQKKSGMDILVRIRLSYAQTAGFTANAALPTAGKLLQELEAADSAV